MICNRKKTLSSNPISYGFFAWFNNKKGYQAERTLHKRVFLFIMNQKSSIIIAKFGGTSVSSVANIKTIAHVVRQEQKLHGVVVIVSALSKVTDLLLALARREKGKTECLDEIRSRHEALIADFWEEKGKRQEAYSYIETALSNIAALCKRKVDSKKRMDSIVSYGEIMSSYIVSKFLTDCKIACVQVVASDIIVTDSVFGRAEFLPEPTKKRAEKILLPYIQNHIVPVVTGFIGATIKGETTTLGRGGSDYSASIIGFSLRAKEVQIWTDVNGIFTADPRLVSTAQPIPEVSYQEASEMAFLGAKVLHPRTIRPAVKAGIPVRVLNTFNPSHKGTTIAYRKEKTSRIIAVTFKKKVVLVTIKAEEMFLARGFLSRIFELFRKQNISIDLVSVSEVTLSLTLDKIDRLEEVITKIQTFAKVVVDTNASVVSIIGDHIGRFPHGIRDIFSILDEKKIRVKMISFSAQNRNISLVIDNMRCEEAVQTLHDRLLLRRKI